VSKRREYIYRFQSLAQQGKWIEFDKIVKEVNSKSSLKKLFAHRQVFIPWDVIAEISIECGRKLPDP